MEIPGGIYPLGCHNQQRHGAVDGFLGIPDALHQIVLLIHQIGHQLRGIQIPAAHLQEMGMTLGEQLLRQLCRVVDLAHRGDGVCPMVGTDHQRLGLEVRDAADADVPLHLIEILVELCPKRRVLYIMYGPVESLLFTIDHHSRPPGSQMGMIVRSEEQVKDTILLGCNTKKSAHSKPPEFLSFFQSIPISCG